MKKYKYILALSLLAPIYTQALTPAQNLLFMDDVETWLNNGESLINWGSYIPNKPKLNSIPKTPHEIFNDFKGNVFLAEKEYKGTYQKVYGNFSSIQKNTAGEPIVIFELNYINHFYVNGLTKAEVENLLPNQPISLICNDIELHANEITAHCSKFSSVSRMVAVNLIQNEKTQKTLDQSLNTLKKDKSYHIFSQAMNKINLDPKCNWLDSTNYESCQKTFEHELETLKNQNK